MKAHLRHCYLSFAAVVFISGLFLSAGRVIANGLPIEVETAKREVIRIASANTTRTDNIGSVREALTPHIHVLAEWFGNNRPVNEIELTQVPWKNLWYDDPDIEFATNLRFGPFSLRQDREKIYQVIEDGYYYNVSESVLALGTFELPVQAYLKGAYDIIRPAGPVPNGLHGLNAVALEFVANSIRIGPLRNGWPLVLLVQLIERGWLPTIAIPGPLGVTGELWNLYVDEQLRVAVGFDTSEPDVIDLYILERVERVGD